MATHVERVAKIYREPLALLYRLLLSGISLVPLPERLPQEHRARGGDLVRVRVRVRARARARARVRVRIRVGVRVRARGGDVERVLDAMGRQHHQLVAALLHLRVDPYQLVAHDDR